MNGSVQILLYLNIFIGLTTSKSINNGISDRTYCGFQHSDDYDRKNDNISIDEFPWMVQLLYNKEKTTQCTGSLINNRYVLTAAHCLLTKFSKLTMVRLGDHNVTTLEDCVKTQYEELECNDSFEDFSIEEIIVHPDFNMITRANNIGLIRLSNSVIFSDFIRPICLPQKNLLENGQNLTTSGWGKVGVGLQQTEVKKRIVTNLVSSEDCKNAYKPYAPVTITDDHVCGRGSESFTCNGDSGGPLMYSGKNQWEQIGVASFSRGCGNQYITVYEKVFNHLEWISTTVRP